MLGSLREGRHEYSHKALNSWNFFFPWGVEKMNFSPKRLTTLKISDTELSDLLFWKKLGVFHLTHFLWKPQTITGTFLSILCITEWMNMNEFIIDRTETNWNSKYEIFIWMKTSINIQVFLLKAFFEQFELCFCCKYSWSYEILWSGWPSFEDIFAIIGSCKLQTVAQTVSSFGLVSLPFSKVTVESIFESTSIFEFVVQREPFRSNLLTWHCFFCR